MTFNHGGGKEYADRKSGCSRKQETACTSIAPKKCGAVSLPMAKSDVNRFASASMLFLLSLVMGKAGDGAFGTDDGFAAGGVHRERARHRGCSSEQRLDAPHASRERPVIAGMLLSTISIVNARGHCDDQCRSCCVLTALSVTYSIRNSIFFPNCVKQRD